MDKEKYLKKYNYIKRRKLFVFLVILFFISILLGVFYFLLGSKSNKNITIDYYNNFFSVIKNGKLDYLACLINSISSNIIETIILFIMSISIIGVIFVFFFFLFHSFTLGYVAASFISFYKLKGIISLIIYIIPLIVHIMALFVLSFYSFNFAVRFYKYLIKKQDIDIKIYFKRYLRVFLGILLFLFINSLLESIAIPFILKTFTNSLI